MCDYTRVHEQKTPGFLLSCEDSTSRCCKLQMMFSHFLPSLYCHVVHALLQVLSSTFVPTDFPGATVGCPQIYRGTSKLELFSMSMTVSNLEPPTNLLMLLDVVWCHQTGHQWILNSMGPSLDLKVQCSFTAMGWLIGTFKPFWACVQYSSHLIVYSSSPVHCFQLSHSSPVSVTSLYCFFRFKHLNFTPTCVNIILDFTTRVNLLFRTFEFLCHFSLTHSNLWSLNLWQKTEVMGFPCEILLK